MRHLVILEKEGTIMGHLVFKLSATKIAIVTSHLCITVVSTGLFTFRICDSDCPTVQKPYIYDVAKSTCDIAFALKQCEFIKQCEYGLIQSMEKILNFFVDQNTFINKPTDKTHLSRFHHPVSRCRWPL